MARRCGLQGDPRCSVCLSASVTELTSHSELVKGTGGGSETGERACTSDFTEKTQRQL